MSRSFWLAICRTVTNFVFGTVCRVLTDWILEDHTQHARSRWMESSLNRAGEDCSLPACACIHGPLTPGYFFYFALSSSFRWFTHRMVYSCGGTPDIPVNHVAPANLPVPHYPPDGAAAGRHGGHRTFTQNFARKCTQYSRPAHLTVEPYVGIAGSSLASFSRSAAMLRRRLAASGRRCSTSTCNRSIEFGYMMCSSDEVQLKRWAAAVLTSLAWCKDMQCLMHVFQPSQTDARDQTQR